MEHLTFYGIMALLSRYDFTITMLATIRAKKKELSRFHLPIHWAHYWITGFLFSLESDGWMGGNGRDRNTYTPPTVLFDMTETAYKQLLMEDFTGVAFEFCVLSERERELQFPSWRIFWACV